ncbi:hypothetical protein FJY63_12335 [Candidatus Sumerlaeota bacterium]|nr:hypothetical protein [Candidatus Sumerlaeota bacterium]
MGAAGGRDEPTIAACAKRVDGRNGDPVLSRTSHWRCIRLTVAADGYERHDKPVEVGLDLTRARRQLGLDEAANDVPIQIAEVTAAGAVEDPRVLFQFSMVKYSGSATSTSGTLVFLMKGVTPADGVRYFDVYFGSPSPEGASAKSAWLVSAENIREYEGEPSFKIVTPTATYFYHRRGSGFASLVDRDGNDWISYHPKGGFEGDYRGIPNIAPPDFHPGRGQGHRESEILSSGPLKVAIRSETQDGRWGCAWEIYPNCARMTLFKKGAGPYWILYEGTPGGRFDAESDYWVNSAGKRFPAAPYTQKNMWHGQLPDPQWVYFGDGKLKRVLYFAVHEPDAFIDEFWHRGSGGMTVFGLGRGPQKVRLAAHDNTAGSSDDRLC